MNTNNIHQNIITGIILAGGKGSRMGGQDKGFINFQKKPLLEHVIAKFTPQVNQLIINANRNINKYHKYGYPVISDRSNDFQGPLAGIEVGLIHSQTPFLVTVPCDTPKLPDDLVKRLWNTLNKQNVDLVVADDGKRMHPVFCLMKTELLPSLQTQLNDGNHKIDLWFDKINYACCDFSDQPDAFDNINTPSDLE